MCVSPIRIRNQNLGMPLAYQKKFPWKDYTSAFIEVPCGHCDECIHARQQAIVQRVQLESTKNHLFMCTLTYQEAFIPFLMINGKKFRYADVHDVQNMLKMLKKYNPFGMPFRYLAVSEFGTKRGRPHFHILFLFDKKYFPREKEDYIVACESFASKSGHYFDCLNFWRRNVGSRRRPVWQPLTKYCEKWIDGVLNKNYDFHYVNPFITSNGVSDCGAYVLKYMFKKSDQVAKKQTALRLQLSPEDYEHVWSIVKPRLFKSIGFGLNAEVQLKQGKYIVDEDLKKKILDDIALSKLTLDYPALFHIDTGKPSPLAEYYRRFTYYKPNVSDDLPYDVSEEVAPVGKLRFPLFTLADRVHFYTKASTVKPFRSFTDLQSHVDRYERLQERADNSGFDDRFNIVAQ